MSKRGVKAVREALDERGIDASPNALDAIGSKLSAQQHIRGVARAGADESGLLVVTDDHDALLWEPGASEVETVDLHDYGRVVAAEGRLRIEGPNVRPIALVAADSGRTEAWLDLFSRFGITGESTMTVNEVAARLTGIDATVRLGRLSRLLPWLAATLRPDESIERFIGAKTMPSSITGVGLLVLTSQRVIHLECGSKWEHVWSFERSDLVGVKQSIVRQTKSMSAVTIVVSTNQETREFLIGLAPRAVESARRFALAAVERIPPTDNEPAATGTKACPWCGETILAVAKKCKHCGEYLDNTAPHVAAGQSGAEDVIGPDGYTGTIGTRKNLSDVGARTSTGQLACPNCGGTQFTAKRSNTGKVIGLSTLGVGGLIAPKSQVKCVACGTMFKRG